MRERLLTPHEVSAIVGVTVGAVRQWIKRRQIDVERVGPTGRVRIRLSTLRRLYPSDIIDDAAARVLDGERSD